MRLWNEFTKGLWKEIPPFRLVLGLCPALACSKSMFDGFGMGLALTFVLVCSNVLISAIRKIIPSKVRIAVFIVIVATFVIVVEMSLKAWAYPLTLSLGVFIPLIVVNCIPLGRAEAFSSKNGVALSFADGLGLGLGYTLSLTFLGILREIFGTGYLSVPNIAFSPGFNMEPNKIAVFSDAFLPFNFLTMAPGAFVCLGVILGLMSLIGKK